MASATSAIPSIDSPAAPSSPALKAVKPTKAKSVKASVTLSVAAADISSSSGVPDETSASLAAAAAATSAAAAAAANAASVSASASASATASSSDVLAVTFATVFAKIAVGVAKFKEITADLKTLQKDTARIAKESVRRPRRVADPTAEPSGFRKPVGLSPEMAAFVGVDLDAKVSRNNVTKAVTTYIKAHNLQDTPDKRVILPDDNLRALLGIDGQKLTYFNLQSFLKKHFLKTDTPVAVSSV